MNNLQRIASLVSKISNLLEAVKKNEGRFTVIEKDLMAGYTRELYELAITIEPDIVDGSTTRLENQLIHQISTEELKKKLEDIPQGEDENQTTLIKRGKDAPTVNEKFKKNGPDLADKLKFAPIKDLVAFIGLNRRFAFVNTLFNSDEARYETEIRKINSFHSAEEALNYIETNLAKEFNWKEEDELVLELEMLIRRRFT